MRGGRRERTQGGYLVLSHWEWEKKLGTALRTHGGGGSAKQTQGCCSIAQVGLKMAKPSGSTAVKASRLLQKSHPPPALIHLLLWFCLSADL